MKFLAELKGVKQTKLQSLDNQYEIRLVTDNPNLLDLGKLQGDTLFNVEIWPEDGTLTNIE